MRRLPFFIALLASLAGCAAMAPRPADTVAVKVLAINDFHGHLRPPAGGFRVRDPQDPAKSIASRTSTALPAVVPSTWFMSVTSACVGRPAPTATSTRLRAKVSAVAASVQKAPLPSFTSITSASSPAASFFDRIDAVIRSILSTVADTSRIA